MVNTTLNLNLADKHVLNMAIRTCFDVVSNNIRLLENEEDKELLSSLTEQKRILKDIYQRVNNSDLD
jgi:hypothetical protein